MNDLSGLVSSQVKGELCPECRQTIEKEIGGALFYLAALCNTLNISLYDVILKEKEALGTLGNYSLR
jgi:NTP pyrophosphatase (non-canonical NTP hydrolase)